MNGIHEDDYSAIGTQHEQVTGRINDLLIELQNHAYATGVERGKELAKQAAIEAGTISPTLCQTIHLGQPGVTVEPCLMLGPDEEEAACLLFTAPGTEVRLTWPTQTQALAVLAAATAEACTEADAPPVTCECGDSYPLSSHGAGFIEGRGHCANCAAGAGEMASLLGVSPAPQAGLPPFKILTALQHAPVTYSNNTCASLPAEMAEQEKWQVRYLAGETSEERNHWQDSSEDRALWCIARNISAMARGNTAPWEVRKVITIDPSVPRTATHSPALKAVPLAPKHQGMRISAAGMLNRVGGRLQFGAREMLKHLEEMATRYYAGDIAAVDEFLQLYCLDEKRPEQKGPAESGGAK
ncbi:hypothetical protein MFKK_24670 [Halopseudomonas aestusnigri]|uniref:hypothetical protein n=1 Tax=Halopseudomonas TaxID=2901189 RepID=UPI0022B5E6E1|nr:MULTISPECIES: hypothetical protein [Halopseudomonas]BDX19657.1 hypothetical protein MFKK_24670 [Halopseudomonas aestusnigri]